MRMSVWILSVCATGVAGLAHGMDSTFEKKLAADPHGVVEITNVAGEIKVSAWDNPEVEVRADVGGGVQRIDTTSEPGRVTIKVVVPGNLFRNASADLRIRVPRQSELKISGVSADVSTSDIEGPIQLNTVSGDVTLRGPGKGTDASIRVSSISGNVHIDRASGDLDATSISGDMSVRLDHTRNVRVRTTSGDLGFQAKVAKGGYVDAETVSGDMTIRVVPESGLDYEVNTFSGDISNCMGVESERVSKYGPGHKLIGSKGQSGSDEVRVRLKAMSGDVELCDRN